jgi:hypothetical protein
MHRRLNGVFSHQVGFPRVGSGSAEHRVDCATKDLEQFAPIAEVPRDRPPVTLRLERPGRPVCRPGQQASSVVLGLQ